MHQTDDLLNLVKNNFKMVMTPSSFTYENLSSLKFKELQKLSVQFHVNKRWAKKQELVENLLALNKKEKESESNQDEENDWKDGSTVFNDLQERNENEVDRKLTFNISTKSNIERNEAHLTFEVPQNGKISLDESENSRRTYDIPPSQSDFAEAAACESRATFDIPAKKSLIDEIDPRATFDIPQNNKKLLNESDKKKKSVKEFDAGKIKLDINVKNGEERKNEKGKTLQNFKTLTIPCARLTRRTRRDGETNKIDSTPIKMSTRSINIKKSTVNKNNLIKSPAMSSLKNSINKQTIIQSLTKPQPSSKIPQSKLPVRLQFNEEKETSKGNKENMKQISRKGVLKPEHLEKNSNFLKVNFRTPPPSAIKTSKTMPIKKTPLRRETTDMRQNTNKTPVPENKPISKPITATKMPDFNKIHKKQFEQMDSLHDYLKKKEDRIRKLFGTPQPGPQLQNLSKTAPVFRFQSAVAEKENKGGDILNRMTKSLKKEQNSKTVQKEAVKSKLPPSKDRADIKGKNRSLMQGVRTNKRFELQMKFRKCN